MQIFEKIFSNEEDYRKLVTSRHSTLLLSSNFVSTRK